VKEKIMAELTANEDKVLMRMKKAKDDVAVKMDPEELQTFFNLFCKAGVSYYSQPSDVQIGRIGWSNIFCKKEYVTAMKNFGKGKDEFYLPKVELQEATAYPLSVQDGISEEDMPRNSAANFCKSIIFCNDKLKERGTAKQKDWPEIQLDFRSLCPDLPWTFEKMIQSWKESSYTLYCNGRDGSCSGMVRKKVTRKNLVAVQRDGNIARTILECSLCKTRVYLDATNEFFNTNPLLQCFKGVVHNQSSNCISVSTTYGGLVLMWGRGASGRKSQAKVMTPSGSLMSDRLPYIDRGFQYLLAADLIGDAIEHETPIEVGPKPDSAPRVGW
jgi:hypothetical protein